MFNIERFVWGFFLAVVNLLMVELFAQVCPFSAVSLVVLEYGAESLKEYKSICIQYT